MNEKYENAVSIIKRLVDNGYEAYIVGGWVRDKLLGITNEETDIDIATSCLVQDIPKLFSDCIYVGMAFGVCIVKVKSEDKYYQFDVATFRWDGIYEDGRRPSQIKTATVEEDAKRRDFTINAIYYDPIEDKYFDFVGGQEDLKNKVIRAVGNPYDRFKEDKLRMLRAIRLAFQLNKEENGWWNLTFEIEKKTREAIKNLAHELLPSVSYERIWHEIDKASKYIRFDQFLEMLDSLGFLSQFLPEINKDIAFWNSDENNVLELLPQNTPTLIKIMACIGTFEEKKVLEIVKRFNLPKPNWLKI